ncbi:hypothetical protein HX870_06780 [Pseudomonas gingeri]|uniref:Uncharacterized protein n=1 Tax=Pseudomonas gingeri TaxID=117681 RepID=A0A7Y8C4W0_9PSED|nr:hypothetical protein [Pseudomonas gingeri]NWB99184.1 hypothetical protein [Pseudomonas gingeri]NWD67302.1 hypothetical protein [Pseudomonas gingeri]NWD75820.1 hypothetical protein [Pseudomonas gingeri]
MRRYVVKDIAKGRLLGFARWFDTNYHYLVHRVSAARQLRAELT